MEASEPPEDSQPSQIFCESSKSDIPRKKRSVSFDVFSRPTAALAQHQHQHHQLSDIGEASISSKQSHLKVRHSTALTNGISVNPRSDREQTGQEILRDSLQTLSNKPTVPSGYRDFALHKRLESYATSSLSLPLHEIPERRSSISVLNQSLVNSRRASIHELPPRRSPEVESSGQMIAFHGRSQSPVRRSLERGAQSSDAFRCPPSRTFVRTIPPHDVLDNGSGHHHRVQMSLRLPAPLFVGGGTIEGQIELNVDPDAKINRKNKPLLISRLTVDVIGVEEISDGKRHVFLSLATELLDAIHPPPPALVKSHTLCKGSELFWETKRAHAVIPFCIHLPLKLGPPPYLSKAATIRYLLCPTAIFKIGKKRVKIRQTWNIQMITVHDPEKALGSLPSPLLASDTLIVAHSPEQSIKMTAGLHRQTWVNGSFLFADLHIINGSTKILKKIELILEKTTLFYSHAAAGTAEKSASHLRLPKRNETEIVSSNIIKRSKNWKGVQAHSSEVRTCELELPRGHVTISSGRYFEVRYYVRIVVTLTLFKSLAVQLPITIIHMNSLDVLPNALAQVAASVEAKRTGRNSAQDGRQSQEPYCQGQAFTVAMRQSLEKQRGAHSRETSEMSLLKRELGNSLRRSKPTMVSQNSPKRPLGSADSDIRARPGRTSAGSHHHLRRHPSCYHCHLAQMGSARPESGGYLGPRLPRLQVSTSGLGFSETEFEVPPDTPPRKVMLSEQERQMIKQQRELKLQRQWSSRVANNENNEIRHQRPNVKSTFVGYRNVAVMPTPQHKHTNVTGRISSSMERWNEHQLSQLPPRTLSTRGVSNRARRQTAPDRLNFKNRDASRGLVDGEGNGRQVKSMDRGERHTKILDPMDDGAVFGNPTARSGTVNVALPFRIGGTRALESGIRQTQKAK